jgi:antitoxin FitA
MTTITVTLPDDRLEKLKETAKQLNVPPEELVRISIEELLAQPDETFQLAVGYVLGKNHDLYRRLS